MAGIGGAANKMIQMFVVALIWTLMMPMIGGIIENASVWAFLEGTIWYGFVTTLVKLFIYLGGVAIIAESVGFKIFKFGA